MKKTENITAAALLLAASIFLSRILGYVREMLLAYKFGASATTDAFYAAFQIPDLMNYFLAGGALSIAFIPLYNKTLAKEGDAAANRLMATVLGTMGALAVLLTGVLWWKAEVLTRLQFPNFDEETQRLTVSLTRIVLPAQIFFVTGGIMQAVLLAHRSFNAAAFAPLIYNFCTIAGGLLLYPSCGIAGFAVGTLIGSILGPFLMPLLYSWRHIPLKPRIAPADRRFLVYLALAAPLMLGQTLLTLDEWYGRWFGAMLSAGSVAYISFARKLMLVPIAVIGQAIAAAALPTLSKLWSENRIDDLNRALLQTLKTGVALSVATGAALFAFADPVVALVYEHGQFGAQERSSVAELSAILALALPAWITQQIIVRAFYARGDTWRPMILGTIVSLAAIPLYFWLSKTLQVQGIAWAGVIGMSVNAFATLAYARKLHGTPPIMCLIDAVTRTLAAALPAAIAGKWIIALRAEYFPMEGMASNSIALADLAAGGIVFTAISLPLVLAFGEEGLKTYLKKLTGRLIH